MKQSDEMQKLRKAIMALRQKVTDAIHMQTALALNCNYKKVEDYLSGNIQDEKFAILLIEMLGHFISNNGGEERISIDANADTKAVLLAIGEYVQRAYRESKATKSELVFLENKLNKRLERIQYTLTDISSLLSKS